MNTILFKEQKPIKILVNKLPEHLQKLFIADGLKGIPSPYRSPWLDEQERKRRGNKRDFFCNCLAVALGASDAPFDTEVLEQIREKHVRSPEYEGEIIFGTYDDGLIDEEEIQFIERFGACRLKWWGNLPFGRPNQKHNYVIGIDPSYGLGSANSAACVYDVNTREQVGSWVDANTKPEDFADILVALAYWVGGVTIPFLIWESNAGCGQNFGNRVVHQSYPWAYTQRREDSKTRKKTKKWGWASSETAKEALLGNLGVALSGGLAGDKDYLAIIIHEEELVNELADYVFKEKGKGIVASSKADLGTGALERHGDRAIAAGLCVLGTKEQLEGEMKDIRHPPVNSFEFRLRQWQAEQEEDKRRKRRFLF